MNDENESETQRSRASNAGEADSIRNAQSRGHQQRWVETEIGKARDLAEQATLLQELAKVRWEDEPLGSSGVGPRVERGCNEGDQAGHGRPRPSPESGSIPRKRWREEMLRENEEKWQYILDEYYGGGE